MVSKKLMAPALAGTGAVGATGSLAWALGLFDGEGLDDAVKREEKKAPPKPVTSVPLNEVQREELKREAKRLPGRTIIKNLKIEGATVKGHYLSGGTASTEDKQAIEKSLTWKIVWNDGLKSLLVSAEEEKKEDTTHFSWECRLKPIFLESIESYHDLTEFEYQGGELIKAIETNNTHREQFVENCSKRRPYGQVSSDNSSSEIYLEIEEYENNKFSFKTEDGYFQKLWTGDFSGVDILSKDKEWLLDNNNTTTDWKIEGTGKKVKVKITSGDKNWNCNISGNYSKSLREKTFKEDELKNILGLYKSGGDEIEKKKYLIRNCEKNKKEIKGLTIQETNDGKWEFKDLKKITQGMYTNPTAT